MRRFFSRLRLCRIKLSGKAIQIASSVRSFRFRSVSLLSYLSSRVAWVTIASIFLKLDEFLLAITCFLVAIILQLRKLWKKNEQSTQTLGNSERVVVSISFFIGMLGLCYLINAYRGDKPWSHLSPHAKPAPTLAFEAIGSVIDFPGQRERAKTFNNKPWDDSEYLSLRMIIKNTSQFPIQNLNLEIISVEEHGLQYRFAAIGQLTDISGVEFHKPDPPQWRVKLKAKDGTSQTFDSNDMGILAWPFWYRVTAPRLESQDQIRLIVATASSLRKKVPLAHLRIKGDYEKSPSEGSGRVPIEQTIDVR